MNARLHRTPLILVLAILAIAALALAAAVDARPLEVRGAKGKRTAAAKGKGAKAAKGGAPARTAAASAQQSVAPIRTSSPTGSGGGTSVNSPSTGGPAAAPASGSSDTTIPGGNERAHAPFTVIVGFDRTADAADRAAARAAVGNPATARLSPWTPDTERWHLGGGRTVAEAIAILAQNPDVRYAEPDYLLQATATSNDTYYTNGSLWGMYGDASTPTNQFGSQAGEAWAAGFTGSRSVYVGVIDEGIDFNHPDLAANIWTNPFDPVNGADDDGNGKIDDTRGWDFFNNDNTVYDGGNGDKHGTHVSGTIGGIGGNGTGVAGVNWNVTLISGKFLGPNGGYTSGAVAALDYFRDLKTRHGLNIVATSNSWGGGGYSQALQDAINRAGDVGMLFVAAAGNSTSNNDTTASYPSNYQCTTTAGTDCVIAVAATTSAGGIASFSSYGATTVDLGAPGSGIYSTLPGSIYGSYSGTSMATPHVSGAVALCASIGTTLTMGQIRDALLASTAPTGSLAGKTVTGGRLDAGAMAQRCGGIATPTNLTITTPALANGTGGAAYTQTLTAAGADGTTTWTATGLPAGLALSSSGVLSGTPSASGIFQPTFTVDTPSQDPVAQQFGLTIAFGRLAPANGARLQTRTDATLSWSSHAGATSYLYCFTTSSGGCVPSLTPPTPGATSVALSGLSANKTYYWRVTAYDASGAAIPANANALWRFTTKR